MLCVWPAGTNVLLFQWQLRIQMQRMWRARPDHPVEERTTSQESHGAVAKESYRLSPFGKISPLRQMDMAWFRYYTGAVANFGENCVSIARPWLKGTKKIKIEGQPSQISFNQRRLGSRYNQEMQRQWSAGGPRAGEITMQMADAAALASTNEFTRNSTVDTISTEVMALILPWWHWSLPLVDTIGPRPTISASC